MHFNLSPDQASFQQAARRFARERVAPAAAAIDERDEFPMELVKEAGALGFMGATIPKEWGGAGADYVGYALALEEIARASATLAVILVVSNSLVVEPLLRFGSEAQKTRWLRALARGERLGSFALSEEDAGTDAANQQTEAVALPGGGFRLSGRKTWVTCGVAADLVIVFSAEASPAGKRAVSAFLLPMDAPGIVRGASRARANCTAGRDLRAADGPAQATRGARAGSRFPASPSSAAPASRARLRARSGIEGDPSASDSPRCRSTGCRA